MYPGFALIHTFESNEFSTAILGYIPPITDEEIDSVCDWLKEVFDRYSRAYDGMRLAKGPLFGNDSNRIICLIRKRMAEQEKGDDAN